MKRRRSSAATMSTASRPPRPLPVSNFGEAAVQALRRGEFVAVNDVKTDPPVFETARMVGPGGGRGRPSWAWA